MNWKIFTTACVSIALTSFPQNIIGCGPDADPYDYYISFFHQNLPEAKAYKPFYYTSYNFLYDEAEPVETVDVLCREWSNYCGNTVTAKDAKLFLTSFDAKDLYNLYFHLEKNQPLKIPDSVKDNSMTGYFMQNKNLEALGYVLYAKKTAPFVGGGESYWEAPVRDVAKMDKLIKNGFQLLNVAKEEFFKLRFTYQILRLAHYSKRYDDVINWYDKHMLFEQSKSIVKNLCTALKAGALYHIGQNTAAAYLFSKVFAAGEEKRVSNYLGFNWSIKKGESRNTYLSLCKNNSEKANMLALFALNSITAEINVIKEIYTLNPGCNALEVLAVREINKLEEKYFTPMLQKDKGGKALYYSWNNYGTDSALNADGKDALNLQKFFSEAAENSHVKNGGLFTTGAAYIAYMRKDLASAKQLLLAAEKMPLTPKVKDQWALTNLLVTISQKDNIDAAFEEQLLPSIKWLEDKAKKESPINNSWSNANEWQKFYRNLMSEILAARYQQQNELHKAALCIGAADYIMKNATDYFANYSGIDYLRNSMVSTDVEKMFSLFDNKQANTFETYILLHNSIKKTDVIDFAGTAYLRDYDYANAIKWFKKLTDKKMGVINTNPFADLLQDREEPLTTENKFTTTKMAFATEMLRLQQLAQTDQANSAKHLYKMANGMYNITYYGHAWKLTQYYRSGSDGYYIPKNATAFQKEYYGCYKALDHFEKAMNSSTDKNFKARCLFMMAKCTQKQLHKPQYEEYASNYDKMDKATDDYYKAFKNNRHFTQLVKEYKQTKFFDEAFSTCTYLIDFVNKK